ncbi:uncharacterized protein LOC143181452 [Calliopsis andreniformis]|uniref:uncharacterized protein LOC143181452 n=1 Tax=Calliopsis andreniformis TaxID=337506 RepID=UPI003FCE2B4C
MSPWQQPKISFRRQCINRARKLPDILSTPTIRIAAKFRRKMNKRKASADRNVKQKTPSRRPSASSLHARTNTVQLRQSRPEKTPSSQHLSPLDPNDSSKMMNKTVNACIPKTRFDSCDKSRELRSCSSPRLKSFPAEKINKFSNSPSFTPDPMGAIIVQQNPRENGTLIVSGPSDQPPLYNDNGGQGDAVASKQMLHQQRHPQNMYAGGQQMAVPNQTHPRSECLLPQQGLNGQPHRPFVPYPRDQSPRKNPASNNEQPVAISQSLQQQIPNNSGSMVDQGRGKIEEGVNAIECPDYEKQPIGGRNAALYRQMVTANGHKQQDQPQSQWANNRQQFHPYAQNNHFRPNQVQPCVHSPHPQQLYQQLQQNTARQQQMQQRVMNAQMQMMNSQQQVQGNQAVPICNEQLSRGRVPERGTQGMTSPQEAAANRMKNQRMPVQQNYQMHQRDLEYTMNPHNGWATNNRETVQRPNTTAPNQQQQFAVPYQQQPAYQYQQQFKNPGHGANQSQQQQQNQPGFDQPANSQQQALVPQANDHAVARNGKNKALQFTAGMIRDQEKLVATMKQQGVPLEIMRRQFDALMNEQRRQLEYIEEIQRQEEAAEAKRPEPIARRKKQTDEKPEWMIHLTPPRLSYTELERLYEERKRNERQTRQLEQVQQQSQPQPQPNGTSHQHTSLQLANQQPPSFWQQPAVSLQHSQPRSDSYAQPLTIPRNLNANQPAVNYQNYQHQQNAPQQQQQHQQHQQQMTDSQYQQYQHMYQNSAQQGQGHFPMEQQTRSTAEPSSLLKMRMYKEVIRPQRRNNGLQDPEVARKQLKELETSAEVKKGLEYLANLASKKAVVKLNGIQERNEMEHEWRERLITSNYQSPPKNVCANGLENERNPDNPPPQRLSNMKKLEQELSREYPRQKQYNSLNCYNVQAERENGTVAVDRQVPLAQQQQFSGHNSVGAVAYNEKNPLTARGSAMPYRVDGTYPQHYQQMQQYYQNAWNMARNSGEGDVGSVQKHNAQNKGSFDRAGGDACANVNIVANGQTPENKMTFQPMHQSQPEIHEARTIGGVKYLARKQDYMPNTHFLPPDALIAPRNLQPPIMMY